MKWIKASESPKGEEHQKLIIKYKGKPAILVMIDTRWCWWGADLKTSSNFVVKPDSWSAIEYLDETPSHTEGEAVAFAEWIAGYQCPATEDYGPDGFTLIDGDWYWSNDKNGDQPLTEEYLYTLFTSIKQINELRQHSRYASAH